MSVDKQDATRSATEIFMQYSRVEQEKKARDKRINALMEVLHQQKDQTVKQQKGMNEIHMFFTFVHLMLSFLVT